MSTSWKLAPQIARDTQAMVATGFATLETGRALFLELPDGAGGGWITAVGDVVPISAADAVGREMPLTEAASIAFTWTGLQVMGADDSTLASFSAPFREGMFQKDRLRRLGDKRKDAWLDTVMPPKPRWSGNIPEAELAAPQTPYAAFEDIAPETEETPLTVHAVLLIYARSEDETDRLLSQVEGVLTGRGISIVHQLPLLLDTEHNGISREHFGFADGLSQPKPYDEEGAVVADGAPITEPDPVHGVPLGEILMGYRNGHQDLPPGPVVPGGDDDGRPEQAGLPAHPEARGFFDLGRNGSYLVVRELHQDVAAFWKSMEEAAALVSDADPDAEGMSADWLAAKVVGRDREGHVLRADGTEPGSAAPANDFLFFDTDRHGLGCPMGSHIRRANPRDALAPEDFMKPTLLKSANNHRILRRGRKYGPNLPDRTADDGVDRGLLFMCLNTDIARQFEFIQQTWLLNPDFGTLFEEVDPLVGPDGWMTIPQDPLRRRIHVQTFVQMAGGEYFFLPGMAALRYLSLL